MTASSCFTLISNEKQTNKGSMHKLKYKFASFGFSKDRPATKSTLTSYDWYRSSGDIIQRSGYTHLPSIPRHFKHNDIDYENEIIRSAAYLNNDSTTDMYEQRETLKRYYEQEMVMILPLPGSPEFSLSHTNVESNEETVENTEEDHVDIMVRNILYFSSNVAGFHWDI